MTGKSYQIPDGQSVAMDAARVFATFAVFLGHATRPDVLFDIDVSLMGRATIPLFLMLSAYLTARVMSRGGKFMKRTTRRYLSLYFVVLPAFFVLLVSDYWLISQSSVIMENSKFDSDLSFHAIARELFQALTYSGEYWRLSTLSQGMFSNQAYWTLDYIMAYSALTGAVYLLRGTAWVAVFVVLLIISGPTVLLLSPLWWMGVLAFELHRRAGDADASPSYPLRRFATLITFSGLAMCVLIEWSGSGEALYLESKMWAAYEWRQYLGMAKRYAWQIALAPAIFLVLLGSKYVITWRPCARAIALSRLAAQYTLPVYATHFTLLYVMQSLIDDYQPSHTSIDPYLMMCGALAITLLIAWLCFQYVKPHTDRAILRVLS